MWAEHLNLFKSNPLWDLNSLSLIAKGTLVVWIFPCNTPLILWSDPTAFIACKLVVVTWLIAYGAVMKPRAPVEQLPHGDAARYALVSRLLTMHLYQVTPPHCFDTKYYSWKYSGVWTGNPQRVDEIVFSQSKQEEVVLEEACMLRSQFIQGLVHIVDKEGKETRTPGKS